MFNFTQQQDAYEFLSRIIDIQDLKNLFKIKIKRTTRCEACGEKWVDPNEDDLLKI